MILSPVIEYSIIDEHGLPLDGGKLYVYKSGTEIPEVTYCDIDGTQGTNPVILDARGSAKLFLDIDKEYNIVCRRADDTFVFRKDNFVPNNVMDNSISYVKLRSPKHLIPDENWLKFERFGNTDYVVVSLCDNLKEFLIGEGYEQ